MQPSSVIIFAIKRPRYGNVSAICHKMLPVFLFFNPQSLFLALEISFRASVSVLLFVEHLLG